MNLLRIITILNWIVIAILAFVLIAEALTPSKGGDAATRGLGQFLFIAGGIILVILLILNLIPAPWAKYLAFGLVLTPFVLYKAAPVWRGIKGNIASMRQDAAPIFDDQERDQAARAIRDGRPEKLKEILAQPFPRLNENGELLGYAIASAGMNAYRFQEKMECIQILFDAGARLDSFPKDDAPIHIQVADGGNYELLKFLLDRGADPNAFQPYLKYAIIFDAVGASREPERTVQVLIEHGADLNATATFDDDDGPITPLLRAAILERWGVCRVLMAAGADKNCRSKRGKTVAGCFAETNFVPGGYGGTQEDYDQVKAMLEK